MPEFVMRGALSTLCCLVDATGQTILRRVGPAGTRSWTGWRLFSKEEVTEAEDRVAEIDLPVVVGIRCIHAGRRQSTEEEVIQDGNAVAHVQFSVPVGVPAEEARSRGCDVPGRLVDIEVRAI